MACSCCHHAVDLIEEGASEVKDTAEAVAVTAEKVVGEVAHEAGEVAEAAVEKAEELAVEVKDLAETVVEEVESVAGNGLHIVKDFFEAKTIQTVRLVLSLLPPVIKSVTDDPEAPLSAKQTKDKAIDLLWPEVEKEAVRQLTADFFGLPDENEDEEPYCCCVAKMRYRLYPYNRGLAGVQQDPFWIISVILSLIPLWSAPGYFFLLIFLLIDKTDEFQLLFFIVQVRGMQFASDGLLQVYFRYFQSFICMMIGDTCETDPWAGPIATAVDSVGYALRILLVWISLILLHCVAVQKRPANLNKTADDAIKTFREGKLHYFLLIDTILSMGGLAAIIILAVQQDTESMQFVGTKACVKVVHGLLCVPYFVLLVVPVLRNIVLHTFPTGYDKKGRCRNYIGAQIKNSEGTMQWLEDVLRVEELEELMGKVKNSFLGAMKSA